MNELMAIDNYDTAVNEDVDIVQLVGMNLGEEEYAIDVLKIQEIIRTVEITIVPRSESFILGVMNLRGKVIPVVDLRVRFNLDKIDFDKSTRIIVVRFEKENIGFVVDEVTQVISINRNMVEPTPPLVGAIGQEYILGICKYNERLMIMLDIDRVVGETEVDSSLRQRLSSPSAATRNAQNKFGELAKLEAQRKSEKAEQAQKAAADAVHEAKHYSMADEVSMPVISPAASKESTSEDAMLDDIENQTQLTTASTDDANSVEQGELDALIAKELAMREAETDELNKKKKIVDSGQPAEVVDATGFFGDNSKPQATASKKEPAVDTSLSIDELIANELAQREAETDALNKSKKATEIENNKSQTVAQESPKLEQAPLDIEQQIASELSKQESEKKNEINVDSLSELKGIAKQIISGEKKEIDVNVKGELGRLLSFIVDLKHKIDDIPAAVINTKDKLLPGVSNALSDVNHTTEKAALNLLGSAQKIGVFYDNLKKQINELETDIEPLDRKAFEMRKESISKEINKANELGFNILEALEFQDITEQKLRKVIKSIEEVGARLGSMLNYMNVKEAKPEYKELLTDLGFI